MESQLDTTNKGFPGDSDGKETAWNTGDLGSIPGLGRSLGEGNKYPLQYSCLKNSMDGGAWQAIVHGVAELDITEVLTLFLKHSGIIFVLLWLACVYAWIFHHVYKLHCLCFCLFYFFKFYFLTLQYCIGFAIYWNESATGIHVFPILNLPPSSLPVPSLWVVPVHQPQASSIMHQTWIFLLYFLTM